MIALLNPAEGVQRYVYPGSPPPATEVICAWEAGHVPIELSSTDRLRVRAGCTVMVMAEVAVHPLASVTVTVYVVVAAGLAVGVLMLLSSSPVTGIHLYE